MKRTRPTILNAVPTKNHISYEQQTHCNLKTSWQKNSATKLFLHFFLNFSSKDKSASIPSSRSMQINPNITPLKTTYYVQLPIIRLNFVIHYSLLQMRVRVSLTYFCFSSFKDFLENQNSKFYVFCISLNLLVFITPSKVMLIFSCVSELMHISFLFPDAFPTCNLDIPLDNTITHSRSYGYIISHSLNLNLHSKEP